MPPAIVTVAVIAVGIWYLTQRRRTQRARRYARQAAEQRQSEAGADRASTDGAVR